MIERVYLDNRGITIAGIPVEETHKSLDNLPTKYIIKKNITILLWKDGTKTIVRRSADDEYNKRLGFLTAYFQKHSGLSKNKANQYLASLVDEDEKKALALIQYPNIVTAIADACNGIGDSLKNIAKGLKNK